MDEQVRGFFNVLFCLSQLLRETREVACVCLVLVLCAIRPCCGVAAPSPCCWPLFSRTPWAPAARLPPGVAHSCLELS